MLGDAGEHVGKPGLRIDAVQFGGREGGAEVAIGAASD
jgi:hypothetical protein